MGYKNSIPATSVTGLGDAATKNVGTAAGDVAVGTTTTTANIAAANATTALTNATTAQSTANAALVAAGTHSSGTLAQRNALTPVAGDTFAVTSGAALGDRYSCILDGTWSLVHAERDAIEDATPPVLAWRFDGLVETVLVPPSGVFVYPSRGSTACNLSVTGAGQTTQAIAPSGRFAFRQPGASGIYAAGPSGTTGLPSPVTALTLSAWVRIRAAAAGTYATLVALQYNSAFALPYAVVALCRVNATGLLRVLVNTTGVGAVESVATAYPIGVDPSMWRFVGVTLSAGVVRLWLDGAEVHSWTPAGGPNLGLGTTSRWVWGDLPGGPTEFAPVDFEDGRLYDSAKDATWWADRHRYDRLEYAGR